MSCSGVFLGVMGATDSGSPDRRAPQRGGTPRVRSLDRRRLVDWTGDVLVAAGRESGQRLAWSHQRRRGTSPVHPACVTLCKRWYEFDTKDMYESYEATKGGSDG